MYIRQIGSEKLNEANIKHGRENHPWLNQAEERLSRKENKVGEILHSNINRKNKDGHSDQGYGQEIKC